MLITALTNANSSNLTVKCHRLIKKKIRVTLAKLGRKCTISVSTLQNLPLKWNFKVAENGNK